MGSSKAPRPGADINQVSTAEMEGLYQGEVREVEESEDDGPRVAQSQPDQDISTVSTLRALIELSPFTNFVMKQAVIRYTHKTIQGRIAKYEEDHKWVAGFCHIADLTLRLLFTVLLVLFVVTVVYKTVTPLGLAG